MKLVVEKATNYSRGITSHYQYEVLNNSKIMNMLSSQLYSDKILAPVRELICNAYDSTKIANNFDNPPVITLPSEDNLEFKIRDYGTGLSEDQLINLYRIYGLSDKDQSNDMIGMMGIGSKSPWAYTNVFTTTSYYNGIKYIYVNNKSGRNGVPELCKLHEEPTNEKNGLEISFVVNGCDIHTFIACTAKVLKYFPINFSIIDETNSFSKILEGLKKNDILYQGTGWRIYGAAGTPKAIMGYVAYPIDKSHVPYVYHNIIGCNIEIEFEIGQIGINLGREELEYTDATKKAISDKLINIQNELRINIAKEIEKCECIYDATVKYKQSPYFIQMILQNISYKGSPINTYGDYLKDYTCYHHYKQYGRNRKYHSTSISYAPKTIFIINDVTQGSQRIIEEFINDGPTKVMSIKVLEKDLTKKETILQDIAQKIGIPKERLKLISEIQKNRPKVKRTSNGGGYPTLILEFSPNKAYSKSSYWKRTKINLNEGGYYIPTSGDDIIVNNQKYSPDKLRLITKHINNCPTIIGLRPSHIKKIKNNKIKMNPGKKWILIFDYIQDYYDNLVKTTDNDDIIKYFQFSGLSYGMNSFLKTVVNNKDFLCDDLKEIILDNDKCEKISKLHSLSDMLINNSLYTFKNILNMEDYIKKGNKQFAHYDAIYDILDDLPYRYNKILPSLIKFVNFLYTTK